MRIGGRTLTGWVRHTLCKARRGQLRSRTRRQLAAIQAAARHRFPAPDIDTMLAEIERGYLTEVSE